VQCSRPLGGWRESPSHLPLYTFCTVCILNIILTYCLLRLEFVLKMPERLVERGAWEPEASMLAARQRWVASDHDVAAVLSSGH
jgi:hypothetical protein